MDFKFFTKKTLSTIIIIALLSSIFIITSIRGIVLLTFVFTFIFYSINRFLNIKFIYKLKIKISNKITISILYLIGLLILSGVCIYLFPVIMTNIKTIANSFANFNINNFLSSIDPSISELLSGVDKNNTFSSIAQTLTSIAQDVGVIALNIFMAYVISFLILFEKKKLRLFHNAILQSKIDFIYKDLLYFVNSFAKAFGEVMKVQVLISFINTIISVIAIAVLGFNDLLGLGIMIFILGLIPVAGVIISIVPLCIIGFNIGGITTVLWLVALIVVIHIIEAYVLNPRIMSHRVSLPVCIIFLILIFSEHLIGPWGLLMGVPLTLFFLKVFCIDYLGALEEEEGKDIKIYRRKK